MKSYDEMNDKQQAVVSSLWHGIIEVVFDEGIPFGHGLPSEKALWDGVVLLVAEQIEAEAQEIATEAASAVNA